MSHSPFLIAHKKSQVIDLAFYFHLLSNEPNQISTLIADEINLLNYHKNGNLHRG